MMILVQSMCFLCSALIEVVTTYPDPGLWSVESQRLWNAWETPRDPRLAADEINITAVLGHTASLPCRVANLHDRKVSWIRGKDLTVLAVDRITVTTDRRISVKHPEETDDWLLEIKDVRKEDDGVYDCQVNTYPKISTSVRLKVIPEHIHSSILDRPVSDIGIITQNFIGNQQEDSQSDEVTLQIRGSSWIQIEAKSTLHLTCEASGKRIFVSRSNSRPVIEWTLDRVPISLLFSSQQLDVRETWGPAGVASHMTVTGIENTDSGTYGCIAHQAEPSAVIVTVTNSYPEAAEHQDPIKHMEAPSIPASDGGTNTAAVLSGAVILVIFLVHIVVCLIHLKRPG